MLFASRIIDRFTGSNLSVAQAYTLDVTDKKDRAKEQSSDVLYLVVIIINYLLV